MDPESDNDLYIDPKPDGDRPAVPDVFSFVNGHGYSIHPDGVTLLHSHRCALCFSRTPLAKSYTDRPPGDGSDPL